MSDPWLSRVPASDAAEADRLDATLRARATEQRTARRLFLAASAAYFDVLGKPLPTAGDDLRLDDAEAAARGALLRVRAAEGAWHRASQDLGRFKARLGLRTEAR